MDHEEQAMTYFQAGRNCCQAVVGAYCQEIGLELDRVNELASHYGGGNYQGLCGALAGTYMVANFLKGTPEMIDPAKCKNDAAGKLVVEMTQEFQQTYGSLYCTKLLGKRPCSEYVRTAVKLLEDNLTE
ncbi:C-GCAxxG-C-C family protein [Enterococcus sp. DIV0170]|jgi:C_GCAxxG_C_C family probable redox protein|uniref:C-GCAxxG-C-C family protein n=1 Tax=Enterococcus sp. DIV0170 TaxID=2774642 RepID=UPI003F2556CC